VEKALDGISYGMYFLYILRTSSNELYLGVTEDLNKRIDTHNNGKGSEWIRVHRNAHLVKAPKEFD
jgi:predicted GIY-YIG superfamily endonuclease